MTITWAPLFHDYGLPLAVMGMLVVFAALILVVVYISALPRLLSRVRRWPAPPPVHAAAYDHGIPPEMLAVIAAAAAECLGSTHRIVHIRELTAEQKGWSLEGRIQHHQSHALGRPDRR